MRFTKFGLLKQAGGAGSSGGSPEGESARERQAEPASTSKTEALPDWMQGVTLVGQAHVSDAAQLPECLRSPQPSAAANLQSWTSISGQDVITNVITNPQWAHYFLEVSRHAMADPADSLSLLRAVQAGGAPLYALAQARPLTWPAASLTPPHTHPCWLSCPAGKCWRDSVRHIDCIN